MLYPRQRHNCYSPHCSFVANPRYLEENNKSLFTKLLLKKYENRGLLYELWLQLETKKDEFCSIVQLQVIFFFRFINSVSGPTTP